MKLFPSLSDELAAWTQRQPVFFTGSAPTHGPHINVSPKGLTDSHFAVLTPNRCAYIDRTGSGCETISHAYENGRLVLMFMSFGPTPRILRLFCRARVVEYDQPAFQDLVKTISKDKEEAFDGARAVVVCDIWQVQTSCGYGVPRVKKGLYAPSDDDTTGPTTDIESLLRSGRAADSKLDELAVFEARPTLANWAEGQVQKNQMLGYQLLNNADSIDGLPGLKAARRAAGQMLWLGDLKAWGVRVAGEGSAVAVGFGAAVVLYFILRLFGVVL